MDRRVTYRVLTDAIKSEILGLPLENNDVKNFSEEELSRLYNLAKFHDVANIVGDCLLKNKLIDKNLKSAKMFLADSFSAINRYERLKFELDAIKQAFEKAKISFMPLKGSIIRAYYPRPEMRTSCDIDIYVDKKDEKRGIDLFQNELNYKFEHQYKDETTFFAESGVCIELHCDLSDGEKDVEPLFTNVFDNAVKLDGLEYGFKMNDEDFAVHSLTHVAKHFKSGGCGWRTILDTYIIATFMKPNEEIIKAKLESVNLYKFYLAIKSLAECWFNGKEFSPTDISMEEYVIEGGVYGTLNNKVVAQQVLGGKKNYFVKRIFPPYSELKSPYPVLIKCPILYPFCLIHRWFKALFGSRRKKAQAEMKINKSLSQEKKRTVQKLFDDVGL